jgi:RimJ/RimL family protein N-acetyltransferase
MQMQKSPAWDRRFLFNFLSGVFRVTILETERLILRKLTTEDAEFIFELLNNPSWIQNIGDRNIRTLDDARAYIVNGPRTSYEKNGFGLWLIVLKETEKSIGMCGLIRREGLEDVDIGYALLPKFWSKGYAVEAAQAVKAYAKDVVGLKRIVAIVDPLNEGSIRVLKKLGLHYEKMVRLSADDIDLKLFAIDL